LRLRGWQVPFAVIAALVPSSIARRSIYPHLSAALIFIKFDLDLPAFTGPEHDAD
jgi:hypothetical protein